MTNSEYTMVFHEDVLELVQLCHAALAQDSPEDETFYLNQILNLAFGYLSRSQREAVEVYLAEKKYLPDLPTIEISK